MRSDTSKMSARLWLITTIPRPRSRNRRIRSLTWAVCSTPSAAVGSSSSTTLESHITARDTATDCRCPPESVAIGRRADGRRTRRSAKSWTALCSIASSLIGWMTPGMTVVVSSRPRNRLATTSRLSHSARSWYTVSMPRFVAS
jgi:hypothetical protein